MQCVFVRHGEASWDAPTDAARPLTAHGQHQVQLAARWLSSQWEPELLIHSPLQRACETADAFLAQYPQMNTLESDSLLPDVSPQTLEQMLQHAVPERLLLVGHNPLFSRLLTWFCGADIEEVMAPASMAMIDLPVVAQAAGRLCWLRHAPSYEQIVRRQ